MSAPFPLPESAGFTWWDDLGWIPPLTEEEEIVLDVFINKILRNICPHCDAEIESREDIAGTFYANPCGHRLFRARIPTGDEIAALELELNAVKASASPGRV